MIIVDSSIQTFIYRGSSIYYHIQQVIFPVKNLDLSRFSPMFSPMFSRFYIEVPGELRDQHLGHDGRPRHPTCRKKGLFSGSTWGFKHRGSRWFGLWQWYIYIYMCIYVEYIYIFSYIHIFIYIYIHYNCKYIYIYIELRDMHIWTCSKRDICWNDQAANVGMPIGFRKHLATTSQFQFWMVFTENKAPSIWWLIIIFQWYKS